VCVCVCVSGAEQSIKLTACVWWGSPWLLLDSWRLFGRY